MNKIKTLKDSITINPRSPKHWVDLAIFVEKQDDFSLIKSVYDEFLGKFPFCVAYWQLYAQSAFKHVGVGAARDIFERGVSYAWNSCELWIAYISFAKEHFDVEEQRLIFQRAVIYCGKTVSANCSLIWTQYLEFEEQNGNMEIVARIYAKIFKMPLFQLEKFYSKFEEFSPKCKVHQLLTQSEKDEKKMRKENGESTKLKRVSKEEEEEEEEGKQKEENSEGSNEGEENEEEKALREEVMKQRKEDYEQSLAELKERLGHVSQV
eukprot:MONOS_8584.1-p1 / transcript=MONOS_8584.1 / gene=MONOS_8584 / organism=Monocercomonoides_exilis_PA203 / gene_product=pre-mRNA-processing factor 39 / transcript_product=pre-mRNA-processing factor 39 / location=Mono_scaffold00327:17112-18264(+) / protein_length=265 / sequence_SO=supercontig / SO=protein_coding / is_pseudo=false